MTVRLRWKLVVLLLLTTLASCSGLPSQPCPLELCYPSGNGGGSGSSGGTGTGSGAGTGSAAGSNGSVAELSGDLKTIVDLTNAERSKRGVPPLTANTLLMAAASLTTNQLISSGIWAHVMPGTRYPDPVDRINAAGYRWTWWGENLGKGAAGTTPSEMISAWVASPAHYANIVNTAYTEIGVAIVASPDGTVYMTEEFGHP